MLTANLIEPQYVCGWFELSIIGKHTSDLPIDLLESLAQRTTSTIAQQNQLLDNLPHRRPNVFETRTNIIQVEKILALGLLLHVPNNLENLIVLLEQHKKTFELLLNVS